MKMLSNVAPVRSGSTIAAPSGVVGRERMGTAFPHKKLSGNSVPTREILRDIFLLAIFHYRHIITLSTPETISKLDIRICKVLAH